MQNKKVLSTAVLSLALGFSALAQPAVKFSLNGLGRSYNTYNHLSGNVTDGDTKTRKSGLGGYDLFDLQTNISSDSAFTAMAVFRTKSDFGAFFGSSTTYKFRMFRVSGKVQDFKYEIGDIRVQMTPFTVFNSVDMYNKYESEIFQIRRGISEYENLNQGNSWLLQGAHVAYGHNFNDINVGAYGFISRLVPTNDLSTSDRILAGGRLGVGFGDVIKVGGNYVGMYDNPIKTAAYLYSNHVGTGDFEYMKDGDASLLTIKLEGGASSYKYQNNAGDTSKAYKDYFFDLNAGLVMKDAGLKFNLNVTDVGPYFNSPSAQTRRVLCNNMPSVFPSMANATLSRTGNLFDRMTDPTLYNSQIKGVLSTFRSEYNNAQPFGKATPNRQGASIGVSSDTTMKNISFEVGVDYLMEIVGEGTTEKRNFLVAKGGVKLDLGKMADVKRKIDFTLGGRMEKTSRDGSASVALMSTLVDAGLSFEVVKKVDLIIGYKTLMATGNEYQAPRDNYNQITNISSVNIKSTEGIASGAIQLRFSPSQAFSLQYNMINYNNSLVTANSYNISQFLVTYTGKF